MGCMIRVRPREHDIETRCLKIAWQAANGQQGIHAGTGISSHLLLVANNSEHSTATDRVHSYMSI